MAFNVIDDAGPVDWARLLQECAQPYPSLLDNYRFMGKCLLLPKAEDNLTIQWSAGQDPTSWGPDPTAGSADVITKMDLPVVYTELVKPGDWFIITPGHEPPNLMPHLRESLRQMFMAKMEEKMMEEWNKCFGAQMLNQDGFTATLDPQRALEVAKARITDLTHQLAQLQNENATLRELNNTNGLAKQDLVTAREMIDMQGRVMDMLAEQVGVLFQDTNSRATHESCQAALNAYHASEKARKALQEHFNATPDPAPAYTETDYVRAFRQREAPGAAPVAVSAMGHGGPGQAPQCGGGGGGQSPSQASRPYGAGGGIGVRIGSWSSVEGRGGAGPSPRQAFTDLEEHANARLPELFRGFLQRYGFKTAYIEWSDSGPWVTSAKPGDTIHNARFEPYRRVTDDAYTALCRAEQFAIYLRDRCARENLAVLWRLKPEIRGGVNFQTGKQEWAFYARYAFISQVELAKIATFDFDLPLKDCG